MPEHVIGEPVDVVRELRAEPRLADTRRTRDPDQPGDAAVDRGVEEILDQAQLGGPTDERRLERRAALGPGNAGNHPQSPEQAQRLRLALDRVLAGVLEGDRRRGDLTRGLVDEQGARLRGCLGPGGDVDPVADHHALARIGQRGDLAGCDAGPRAQLRRVEALAEGGHRVDQLDPGADRPLRIVPTGDRHPPDGHHRVADELVDRASIAVDDRPRLLEVAAQQVADVLGVAGLGEARVADQIDEQHRGDSQLGLRVGRRRHRERDPALVAELLAGLAGGAAAWAGERQPGAAGAAEAGVIPVLGLAGWAEHQGQSGRSGGLAHQARRIEHRDPPALGPDQVEVSQRGEGLGDRLA